MNVLSYGESPQLLYYSWRLQQSNHNVYSPKPTPIVWESSIHGSSQYSAVPMASGTHIVYDMVLISFRNIQEIHSIFAKLEPYFSSETTVLLESTSYINLHNMVPPTISPGVKVYSIVSETSFKKIGPSNIIHLNNGKTYVGSNDSMFPHDEQYVSVTSILSDAGLIIHKCSSVTEFMTYEWKLALLKICFDPFLILFEIGSCKELEDKLLTKPLISGLISEVFRIIKHMDCKLVKGYESEESLWRTWVSNNSGTDGHNLLLEEKNGLLSDFLNGGDIPLDLLLLQPILIADDLNLKTPYLEFLFAILQQFLKMKTRGSKYISAAKYSSNLDDPKKAALKNTATELSKTQNELSALKEQIKIAEQRSKTLDLEISSKKTYLSQVNAHISNTLSKRPGVNGGNGNTSDSSSAGTNGVAYHGNLNPRALGNDLSPPDTSNSTSSNSNSIGNSDVLNSLPATINNNKQNGPTNKRITILDFQNFNDLELYDENMIGQSPLLNKFDDKFSNLKVNDTVDDNQVVSATETNNYNVTNNGDITRDRSVSDVNELNGNAGNASFNEDLSYHDGSYPVNQSQRSSHHQRQSFNNEIQFSNQGISEPQLQLPPQLIHQYHQQQQAIQQNMQFAPSQQQTNNYIPQAFVQSLQGNGSVSTFTTTNNNMNTRSKRQTSFFDQPSMQYSAPIDPLVESRFKKTIVMNKNRRSMFPGANPNIPANNSFVTPNMGGPNNNLTPNAINGAAYGSSIGMDLGPRGGMPVPGGNKYRNFSTGNMLNSNAGMPPLQHGRRSSGSYFPVHSRQVSNSNVSLPYGPNGAPPLPQSQAQHGQINGTAPAAVYSAPMNGAYNRSNDTSKNSSNNSMPNSFNNGKNYSSPNSSQSLNHNAATFDSKGTNGNNDFNGNNGVNGNSPNETSTINGDANASVNGHQITNGAAVTVINGDTEGKGEVKEDKKKKKRGFFGKKKK